MVSIMSGAVSGGCAFLFEALSKALALRAQNWHRFATGICVYDPDVYILRPGNAITIVWASQLVVCF
ncbi:hypothetical protein HNQ36_004492 [Afipia massiliensis]|uniref:Uncharacterized protein n=1 Tax=Afipia massiliensis TaxID=211460 RepID=A0A840N5M6_9BRAD|nr:hypothetical protein [Afipia massiliensis]